MKPRNLIGQLKYRDLAAIRPDDDAVQSYLIARARLVLGQAAEAASLIPTIASKDADIAQLLRCAETVFQGGCTEDTFTRLQSLTFADSDESEYFQAEAYFLIGFGLNKQDQFERALAYHELAIKHYYLAAMPGPKAIALFNLAVANNHLGEWQRFDRCLAQLADLASQHQRIRLPAKRLQLYRLIDCADWQAAERLVYELLEICRSEGRKDDCFALTITALFINVKLGKAQAIDSLYDSPMLATLKPEQLTVLQVLEEISGRGMLSEEDLNHFAAKLNRSNAQSYQKLFCFDLLVDRCRRTGDWEVTLTAIKMAKQLAALSQQHLALVDFRLTEAEAAHNLGETNRAQRLAQAYRSASLELRAPLRVKIADQFINRLACKAANPGLLETAPKNRSITIFLDRCSIRIGREQFDLNHCTTVFDLIRVIAMHPSGLTIEEAFKQIYGNEFNPFLHQERFNSLIARTRRMFGKHKLILRSSGKLKFYPDWQISIEKRVSQQQARQETLVSLIDRFPHGVQLGQLKGHFNCSARTLQLDLADLTKRNLINSVGTTKSTKYFINGAQS